MTDVTAASPTDRWWLQDQYRDQFEAAAQEGGQMAPRSWENRPDEGERFKKFLAGLNPLHHIPGVNLVYRELTGEKLEPGQQILGGAIFGGVVGLISGLVNAVVSSDTGKDIAGTVMGIFDTGEKAPAPAAVAAAKSPPAPPVQAAVVQAGADGKLPDVLDLDAIAPAAGPAGPAGPVEPPAAPPPKPVAAAPVAAAPPITVAAATDDRRWFPARGREHPRSVSTVPPATSPAVMALQNSRAEARMPLGPGSPSGGRMPPPGHLPPVPGLPAGAGMPVTSRAGADAYSSALELSRELQKHYLGAQ